MINNGNGLITLPKNPLWEVSRRFGADELLALIINFSATLGLSLFFATTEGAEATKELLQLGISVQVLFAVVGPIVEKIGFFPLHFREAFVRYRSTPTEHRLSLYAYFKLALHKGMKSLLEDVLIHDPIYIGIMWFGLSKLPQTPAWMLSVFAFVVAVIIVAILEVSFVEVLFKRCKCYLKKIGFQKTIYLESRFHFDDYETAQVLFSQLARRYDLGETTQEVSYRDKYLSLGQWAYNMRKIRVRFRERGLRGGNGISRAIQVVFTRVGEMSKREAGQFRYYPALKEKFYFRFSDRMYWNVSDIPSENVKKFVKKFHNASEEHLIEFERTVANNPKTLLISIDHMSCMAIVEIKAYPSQKRILKEAMRLAMHAGGMQTTHGKQHIKKLS